MTAPDNLYQLVEKFERDQSRFQQPDYNEAQLRQEFVNPFFATLGWDVGDSKQVLHEAGLRSGGSVKHPDYSFLAGSRRAFYVETKKPSINIGSSVEPAEQLRSYGWSGNTALGILTNFAEFAVYDCRIEPKQGDSPAEARIMYLTHSQYLDQWERLQETLSPEAVRQGVHRDLLETTAKGVLRVDEAFLRDMETWRVDLAEHLHKQARFIDRTLNQRELNLLVQRTIDRIVFLRIAEDRNLESYGRLERAALSKGVYAQIKKLYLSADRRYNSGLFHFNPADKSRPDADTLSLDIYIVDNVLRRIINRLYPPESRYQFSVISADILGQVYERFLGKVIEVRSDGIETSVTVEEKPEVRKAGGVYYTPSYIVDYIVENTVGTLLKDKTPAQAAKLRVLDPACGSGSFLTGAYQYLLDWHLSAYRDNPGRYKNRIRHSADGIILRIEEKRRILLDNIYGVDLDQNAVEVSKLSLLLKMLENEHDTLDIEEPLLPDLSGNIKWGNSLIGSDFFSGDEVADADDEELLRVKPFDWASSAGFGEIMATGGFDAVIGNPPYVSMLILDKMQDKAIKPYWKGKYASAAGAFDIFVLFVEKGITLLKENGLLGFIVPNKFLAAEYAIEFRKWLLANSQFVSLTDYSRVKVWSVSVYPMIPVFRKSKSDVNYTIKVFKANSESNSAIAELPENESSVLRKSPDYIWSFLTQKGADILIKLLETSTSLEDVSEVFGSSTVAEGSEYPRLIYESNEDNIKTIVDGYSRFVVSGSVFRYMTKWETDPVRFTRKSYENPLISLSHPMPERRIQQARRPKLMVCKVALEPRAFLDINGEYSGAYVTYIFEKSQSLHYLCGLINSKLIAFLFRQLYDALAMSGGYMRFQPPQMRRLPIRTIDFDNPADVAMHDKMVELVDVMLDLHRQLPGLTAVQRGVVEQRIETTDREIDELVYELYGLSEDEREIVEGG